MGKKSIIAIVLIVACILYAGLIEPYWIRVVERRVEVEAIGFAEIKIVHIADLHTSHIGIRERKVVSVVSKVRPDFVFITGDLLKNKVGIDAFLELIPQINSTVYIVLGNADGKIRDGIVSGSIPDHGKRWKILMNESVDCGGFSIVGIDDAVTCYADVKKAFQGVDPSKPAIVLSHFHSDALLSELAKRKVLLFLTGHTHGGQIALPGVINRIGYVHRSRFISGLHKVNGFYLNITKGVGTNIFPFRLFCPPEICILRLKGKQV